ncbi:hypothetical protein [Nocardia sp. NPDC004260]
MSQNQTTRRTDEQLRRIAEGADLYPDERTPQARGVASMAKELLALRTRAAELEAERDSARAQFGLLFDFLAERGASFTTEQGKVVAVQMPTGDQEAQVQR